VIQSESDFMSAHAMPSGFTVPYNFSISLTFGFACRRLQDVFSCRACLTFGT